MNRRSILVAGLMAGALMLSGCDRLENTTISGDYLPNFKYKLTVEVDTPEGVKTGSSVVESIRSWRRGGSARGQAVAVDMPGEQTLFIVLRAENIGDWATYAMNPTWPEIKRTGDSEKDVAELLRVTRAMGRMPFVRRRLAPGGRTQDYTPIMVRFRDINDPMTVEKVDPDNMAASFGEGVALQGLFIEITDEPVTTGIEKRFPWWSDYMTKHFDGTSVASTDMTNPKLSGHLSSRSFSTENRK